MTTSDVLFSNLPASNGSVGLITLNRPEQLNALNHAMVKAIYQQLQAWTDSAEIKAVVVCGLGRAFCAGGDLRTVYQSWDQPKQSQQFFQDEYRLNRAIFHFPKPYVALMDGITMGGGAGIAINGNYRIATEKLKFAMPETGIGFFTDVGSSYFLNRCPGKIGWYLGLTGSVITAADAHYAGLVDLVIDSKHTPELLTALAQTTWPEDWQATLSAVLMAFATSPAASTLASMQTSIDRCFSASIEQILACLDQQSSDTWSQQTSQRLRSRSPFSLKLVLEQLNRGKELSFDECMRMEYRIANRFVNNPDFREGIRAAVIDKDHAPHWHTAQLAEVNAEAVANYFLPLPEQEELVFD